MSTILPILLQPHPTLSTAARPADGPTPAVRRHLDDMLATLYRADGVGLAAPQVGLPLRLVVMDLGEETPDGKRNFQARAPLMMINPEIVARSAETKTHQEGCLSLPGLWADVERPAEVEFKYMDINGNIVQRHAGGLLAVCVQHEIDHLDGIVFIERLSRVRRDIAQRKWLKLRKELVRHGGDFDLLDGKTLLKGGT